MISVVKTKKGWTHSELTGIIREQSRGDQLLYYLYSSSSLIIYMGIIYASASEYFGQKLANVCFECINCLHIKEFSQSPRFILLLQHKMDHHDKFQLHNHCNFLCWEWLWVAYVGLYWRWSVRLYCYNCFVL